MRLPFLRGGGQTAGMLSAFGGLNTCENAGEGDFAWMTNLSGRAYPYLATRGPRSIQKQLTQPGGLLAWGDSLVWVDGDGLFRDGARLATVTPGAKRMAALGARLLVWPDKLAVNLETGQVEALEHRYAATGPVTLSQSNLEGAASDTATFVKIAAAGIGNGFRAWDGVEIGGLTGGGAGFNGKHVLYAAEPDYLLIPGVLPQSCTQNGGLTAARTCPELDFLAVHQNRVWGCSNATREIYACKLGDPSNWNAFAGTAGDSYAVSTGEAGAFTGAAAVNDAVVFFHEEGIHKVLGTRPSNYQVIYTPARGVMQGCEASLCQVEGQWLYLSPGGVCAYDGALPTRLSRALEGWNLKNGVAGAVNGRYYLSCQDQDGKNHLLVYTLDTGLWHREDDIRATAFATAENRLYLLAGNALYQVDSGDEAFSWECVTGRMALDFPGHKTLSRLTVQCEPEPGAQLELALRYEDEGPWEVVAAGRGQKVLNAYLRPHRASFVRLRLRGRGGCQILSLTRHLRQGSEIHPWKRA